MSTNERTQRAVLRTSCTFFVLLIGCLSSVAQAALNPERLNDLDGLWNFYRFHYIEAGRVISHDEGGVTTSEGQSYAMLRAVWSGDRETFDEVWRWTQRHLSREDDLYSWRWRDRILDANAATDADTDIALALLLAARRFDNEAYAIQAAPILDAIWRYETVRVNGRRFVTGGNWAPAEKYPTIHVGYLAPYAYEVFAKVDTTRPWSELIDSSYAILEWLYLEQKVKLPPEKIYIDKKTGAFLFNKPGTRKAERFSYDVFPIFWRVAADELWFARGKQELRDAMLAFFEREWSVQQKFFDKYSLAGKARSDLEALPLYATVAALAHANTSTLVTELEAAPLDRLWTNALEGRDTPYYLHNWLWFDTALRAQQARHFDEFLAFLYPFDFSGFEAQFPLEALLVFLVLAFLCRFEQAPFHIAIKAAMVAAGLYLCGRYLLWRMLHSLNFVEPSGPIISIVLLMAEFYCFSTVLLLLVQTGLRPPKQTEVPVTTEQSFSVDVFIPIYSESLEILEHTVVAAMAMNYTNKCVYVCDDSHRDEVAVLAEKLGAVYVRGPRKHAKAGNINNALAHSSGDLVLIFDTDHIPVRTFLDETVPYFAEPDVGFVQTAHHFYNKDIFQTALRTGDRVPDEQDVFHHAIQPARDNWGGAFFVGTGAVFRRKALEEIGGLQLMSITEDIHTSQHLHARGWKSRYVAKNLAAGLNAENLSSYLVQRTRWMQGCLQVLFKDNPLFMRGLSWRHKLGYFASQYYFLFPAARVIFLLAPLCFLFFHWHPIFADLSTLLAYLIPFMIALPILSQSLLPGWPRFMWASAYENTVAVPLFRAMFDLILPKKLGFKVTPKGVEAEETAFDFGSSRFSLLAAALTLVAIVKGLWEFHFFGIEKDAYFFNLAWACVNLLLLTTPLIVAYERPRAPHQERIRKSLPVTLRGLDFEITGTTRDLDFSGLSLQTDKTDAVPTELFVVLGDAERIGLKGRLAFFDDDGQGTRIGIEFEDINDTHRHWILLNVFCDPATWTANNRSRSNSVMGLRFLLGILSAFRAARPLRRTLPRRRQFRLETRNCNGIDLSMLVTNTSTGGCGGFVFASRQTLERISQAIAHKRCVLPGIHRVGLIRVTTDNEVTPNYVDA